MLNSKRLNERPKTSYNITQRTRWLQTSLFAHYNTFPLQNNTQSHLDSFKFLWKPLIVIKHSKILGYWFNSETISQKLFSLQDCINVLHLITSLGFYINVTLTFTKTHCFFLLLHIWFCKCILLLFF